MKNYLTYQVTFNININEKTFSVKEYVNTKMQNWKHIWLKVAMFRQKSSMKDN